MASRSRLVASVVALAAALVAAAPASAAVPERTGRAVVLLGAPRLAGAGAARTSAVSAARARIARVVEEHGLRRVGPSIPELDAVRVQLPPGGTVAALRRRLLPDRAVVAVQPEYRRHFQVVPNDPAYGAPDDNAPAQAQAQWHLEREGFPAAWDVAKGTDLIVGVVDSGIDGGHPDLQPKLVAAVDQDASPTHGPGDTDENGHGTHVSGLACAASGNAYGVASAGHDCKLVLEKTDLSDTSVADSIVDAADRGARVINLSLGGPGQSALIARAVDYAWSRDVVLVVSAGNDASDDQGQPANLVQPSGTAQDINAGRGLVVTAAEFDDTRADFAGFGGQISMAAYGHSNDDTSGILSTFPAGTTELETGTIIPPSPPCFCRASVASDNRFAYLSGSSMAAPQVAGAVALVRALNPSLGAKEVITILKRTARRANAWSAELGWGIVDAAKAVAAAREIDRHPPVSRARSTRRVRSRRFTVRVKGRDPAPAGLIAAGVKHYDVYMAKNRSKGFRRVKRLRGTTRFKFKGARGSTYRFYSRAVDKAGNTEPVPRKPDSRTTIKR